ncbi:tRNA pseudouridine(13) synthase TruD [Porticoccus sp. W117]|uniref:tRNA pseudouridine(13) synthase TruD n=1 Tax=Porticoccus sp. W117 TaxID=3054777 RepID=UPI00259149B3|nr:tRNA pseudouridine(13) synthase TruD [Porticoccus sp. W117]MDM3870290.1 tRNA pseudouridine(13) synthase TruD [Porticoccus sp. W117]
MTDYSLDFPFAHGGPLGSAGFRTEPEDFVVDEALGFEPCGDGEHLLLHLRKRNQNTRWLAQQLADIAGLRPMDVGYCGLKDRRAVTSQWFSLYLPKQELDMARVHAIEGVDVLASDRHNRKLRRGDHAGNHFEIRLQAITGDRQQLQQRLEQIAEQGVPNYFGEQRFGHHGNNLREFEKRFVGQSGDARANQRRRGRRPGGDGGIVLSAGRSYLFNRVLAQRVEQGNWYSTLPGEEIPTGAMWGRGRSSAPEAVRQLEQMVVQALPGWCDALEHSGLGQERRPLQLLPDRFEWRFDGEDLLLQFSLPPGAYATAVIRELTTVSTDRDRAVEP